MPLHISTSFCGNFMLGDNAKESVRALQLIYNQQLTLCDEDAATLRKPLIVLCASITEAFLYDFVYRIRHFTREGVSGIADSITRKFRGMANDDFSFLIEQCQKHELLGARAEAIYDDLKVLRDLRNRIHIQNKKKLLEAREIHAFSERRQKLSERTLEYVLKYLERNYARKNDYVGGITLPWNAHVP